MIGNNGEEKEGEDDDEDNEDEDENEGVVRVEDKNDINFFDRLIYLFSILVSSSYDCQYIHCLRIFYNSCSCGNGVGQTVAE